MRLKEYLTAECGTASELRSRLSNRQVTLNGDIITNIPDVETTQVEPLGDWLVKLPTETLIRVGLLAKIYDIDTLADCNSQGAQEIFANTAIIRISKKQVYIFTV